MCVLCLMSSCRLCLWYSFWKSSPSSLYSTTFMPSLTSPPSQPDFNQSQQFSPPCLLDSVFPFEPGHPVPLISDLRRVLHRQSLRKPASMLNKWSTFLNVNQLDLRGLAEVEQSRNSCCFLDRYITALCRFATALQDLLSHSRFWNLPWLGGPMLTGECPLSLECSPACPPPRRSQPLVARFRDHVKCGHTHTKIPFIP